MKKLQYDDIDGINAAATDDFGEFGVPVEVTQAMIDTFADVTRDHQWIHVDRDQAADGPFGTTIAHGFLSLSLLPHLVVGQIPVTGQRNVVNYGADSLRFILPVPSGSRVHARTKLLGAVGKDSGTLVKTSVAVHIVGVETPSVLYRMLTLYQG
jgi:acyl dehydratase